MYFIFGSTAPLSTLGACTGNLWAYIPPTATDTPLALVSYWKGVAVDTYSLRMN